MPGKVKVKIVAGRSLPVMDRSNDTTDAYVEVKLGQMMYRTDVCRKSLNPQWNSEWFKFEMDDLELQDEPLQIRLMDYDVYSANDAIGKVYLDLNPLLINSSKTKVDNWGKTISGWIPVFDTMHGLRGEVNVIVKVELFSDLNKYRQSSCGVRFFFSPHVPEGFVAHSINGFVEELVINDDPEYQWIDKIRTPRASNEARQTLFLKLSGEVQRKVGLKTLELGGNAVVGYKQCLDLEGESGIVVRGIGTAMYLTKLYENQLSPVPMATGEVQTKESHSLLLCHQNPVPRKRKQKTPSPHLNPRLTPEPKIPPLVLDDNPTTLQPSIVPLTQTSHPLIPFSALSVNLTTPSCISSGKVPPHALSSEDREKELVSSGAFPLCHHKKHLAQMEPDFELEPEAFDVMSRLSEISEERESQERSSRPGTVSHHHHQYLPNMSAMPASLSEKESDDYSISDDSPPTSPTSTNTTGSVKKFTILTLKRKQRAYVTRRDRLSTNCLVKRASSGPKSSSSSSSTTKLKEEFSKIFSGFKRISLTGDGDDSQSNKASGSKGPYRQPRKLFFRRRRRSRTVRVFEANKNLVRSSSDQDHSLSLMQTSSESLPSIGSEPPAFNFAEDQCLTEDFCSSLVDIPTYLQQDKREKSTLPKKSHLSKKGKVKPPNSVQVDHAKLKELIGDLGYDPGEPLKLYISSMDALLVYDPASGAVNSSCVCLNADSADYERKELHRQSHSSSIDDKSVKDRIDTLLQFSRSISSSENTKDIIAKPRLFSLQKRRKRHETLVECNSSLSNSNSSTSTSSSTSLSTSGTSSSCRGLRKMRMKRTDDDEVDELEMGDNFRIFEKSGHSDIQNIGLMSSSAIPGCRSPIPEELESSSCVTPSLSPPPSTNKIQTALMISPQRVSAIAIEGVFPNGMELNDEDKGLPNVNNNCQVVGSPEQNAVVIIPKNGGGNNKSLFHRRGSESDLSTTPKGGMGGSFVPVGIKAHRNVGINVDQLRMQEFPFITLSQFPEGFIQYIGGTVTARAVKLLKSIGNFEEPDPETRDGWWNELRLEMRSHCRAFGCNILLDYEEYTTMCEEVAILSASGTAAIVTSVSGGDAAEGDGAFNQKDHGHRRADSIGTTQANPPNGPRWSPKASRSQHEPNGHDLPCSMLHIPQASLHLPTIVKKARCAVCKKGKVPDVLLCTIEVPPGLHRTGRSCLVQAQVFRPKKENKTETGAKEMSDSLPFLEYELHRRLINKVKVKGMNSVFGLKVQITQGDKVVVGVATGTAVFLTALPVPTLPTICAGNLKTDSQKVLQYQKVMQETFEKNREVFGVRQITPPVIPMTVTSGSLSDGESDDEMAEENETKDTFVLEVDDAEDIDIITMLIDPSIPTAHNIGNIETVGGYEGQRVLSQQMFNHVWRCKIPSITQRQLTTYFDRLIRSISFKLRRMQPFVVSKLQWNIDLPEADEMQLCVIGMALGLDKKPLQSSHLSNHSNLGGAGRAFNSGKQEDESDMIFPFEEEKDKISSNSSSDNLINDNHTPPQLAGMIQPPKLAIGPSSPSLQVKTSVTSSGISPSAIGTGGNSSNHFPGAQPTGNFLGNVNMPLPMSKMRHWVEVTPLSSIPGAKIERYLGNLNFFFIRETTSLRESGGISSFVHSLFIEVLAIVRAHASALGGNAMVSYFMNQCALLHNPHKNQGQCVINVGGDVVFVTYPMGAATEGGGAIS